MIIIVCGYKRSGKDTVADYLVKNKNFIKIRVAEKLKQIVKILFDFTENQIENDKDIIDERWGMTPRKILQFFGTDILQYSIAKLDKKFYKNFQIKSLLNTLDITKNYVCCDVRFMHEYNEIKIFCEQNNIILKSIRIEREQINQNDIHISETEYKEIPVDFIIQNNSSINNLYDLIEQLCL